MVFPTVQFAIFFPIVLALSWALMPAPERLEAVHPRRELRLLRGGGPAFCLLLGGITLGNQAAAQLIHRTRRRSARRKRDRRRSRSPLDLPTLGVFKYYGFFATEVNALLDTVGLGMPLPLLTIALPVGISFFTFQAISYVVDVKRRLHRAGLDDRRRALPQLLPAPRRRARSSARSEFLPQLQAPRDPRKVAVGAGSR